MDFAMDGDVVALVDSVADFFERRQDAKTIADATSTSSPADRRRWSALCEMGLPMFRIPAPDGVGAGLLEATALAEKTGAVLLPEPAVESIVLARALSSHPQANGLLDGVCSGARITALCGADGLEFCGDGGLRGQARVPDDLSDAVAFIARDHHAEAPAVVVVDRAELPTADRRADLDPTRPVAELTVDGAEPSDVLPLDEQEVDDIRRELAVLTTAELVGSMQRVLAETVGYVTEREQFGRPIGGFQAIKHRLADMYVATEQARAAVQYAAIECAERGLSAATAVASVARWVPRSAINLFEAAIHLHGGMGYSWEVDVHLHLRRALATHHKIET
ncbi:acyl-CoA dehydrogenase family protein [Mycolicibacterium sp. XJ1819]